jgi:hypothetical protein
MGVCSSSNKDKWDVVESDMGVCSSSNKDKWDVVESDMGVHIINQRSD